MIIRVFPRRTKWTPIDKLSFVGDPPLYIHEIAPANMPVKVSATFTWDRKEAQRLVVSWARFFDDVECGGPAFNDPGGEFVPGRFIKEGVTITSRGCPFSCPWCLVPAREGNIRELPIKPGHIVQDNNLLACSPEHIKAVFAMLSKQGKAATFAGGLDSKLLSMWHVELLRSVPIKELWFSCDNSDNLPNLERIANLLHEFSRRKKRCYVLIGFNGEGPEECEARLERVYELGFDPFAQLFRPLEEDKPKHHSKVWRELARKWSRPAAYRRGDP